MSVEQICANRPLDAMLVLDRVLWGMTPGLEAVVDPDRVGTCGRALGGWTAIALSSLDPRPKASFPIAPAWGRPPVAPDLLRSVVRLDDWARPVPTFLLALGDDAALPSIRELYRELPTPKRLAVIHNASGFDKRVSETARALCLAHMDEHLKGSGPAREFLDHATPSYQEVPA
jgi:hypothetical protein